MVGDEGSFESWWLNQELLINAQSRTASLKKAKNKEKREWKKEIREEKRKSNLIEGIKSLLLLCNSGLKLFFFIRFSLFAITSLHLQCIVHLRRLTATYIYKNRSGLSRVYPGWLGPGSTRQVDRVLSGQLLDGFLLRPGPVSCPGRAGSRDDPPGRSWFPNYDNKFKIQVLFFFT
jgi:hypothetical protein